MRYVTKGSRARLVLIVEDDDLTADVLEAAINQEHGYEAERVPNGDAALAALARRSPDLLLLDIQLPGMSGLELYDKIRADDRFKDLPIVFETGGGRRHAEALRSRGIATYVKKPFDLDELVRFVKKLAPPLRGAARPA
jgi:DNA-binding response OmpR family regulator